jgi:ubiquinone/menaquinone biosynthesis C-methylase UbiE
MTGEFKLEEALPWGRNRAEYLAFFDLGELAPGTRVLDVAGGPSCFTAEMTRLGHRAVAADPLYRFSKQEIAERIAATRPVMLDGLRAAQDRFVWRGYGDVKGLEATRITAMKRFLEDYEEGRAAGRYIDASLPALSFADGAFDLALSSHFLFMYSEQFDLAFHNAAVVELCRVAGELRIFPLLDLEGERSRHLKPLLASLRNQGFAAEIRPVAYEFQMGGSEMLRVRPADR